MTRSRRITDRLLPALLVVVAVLVAAAVAALLKLPFLWRYVWFAGMAVVLTLTLGRLKKRRQRRDAEAGDVNAMVRLGAELELEGEDEEAERWYRRAAEAGDAKATAKLNDLLAASDRDQEAQQ
jgi:TPR repeat protein